ncbi:MAG: sterol desaturase family protein [Rhodobacteraceae bacterium]|nr:sterol desaturase family protein [Paracoccaceae bacterium]
MASIDQPTLSPATRAIGYRLALLYSHFSIQLMTVILLGAIIFTALNWEPVFLLLIPAGIGGQMLTEYSIHRHIFHLPPPRNQRLFDLLYLCHYGHHDFPTNTKLFFVPIWFMLPVLVAGFLFYWAIFALLGFASALPMAVAFVFVGHVLTFLGYEWYHMTAHLNIRKFAPEVAVTRRHNIHHFKDFTRMFHVSYGGQIIDRAMGTAIDPDTRERLSRSEFIRTLGMKPDDPRLIRARERFAGRLGLTERQLQSARR